MNLVSNIWDFVVTLYTLPVRAFTGRLYSYRREFSITDMMMGALLGLLIYGITLLIVIAILWGVHHRLTTQPCQHCNGRTREFGGKYAKCDATAPCCSTCLEGHTAQYRAATESKLDCPRDGYTMTKTIGDGNIVADTCPHCKGVFLPEEDLQRLREISYNSGRSRSSSGLATGIATGTI